MNEKPEKVLQIIGINHGAPPKMIECLQTHVTRQPQGSRWHGLPHSTNERIRTPALRGAEARLCSIEPAWCYALKHQPLSPPTRMNPSP